MGDSSHQDGLAMTKAQEVDNAMLRIEGYRNGSFMETMRFLADCQERLNTDDYKNFLAALTELQKAPGGQASCDFFTKGKEKAKAFLLSDPDLVERFDGFLKSARAAQASTSISGQPGC